MTTILSGAHKTSVRNFLWDYFHMVHEHLGYENSKTIDDIVRIVGNYCVKKQIVKQLKFNNPYFKDKFLQEVSGILCYWLRTKFHRYRDKEGNWKTTKEPNKFYLRGLECQKIKGKGTYYYPKTFTEQKIIRIQDKNRVEGTNLGFDIREGEREIYSKDLIEHKEHPKLDESREIA